jgi:hypothetical protein
VSKAIYEKDNFWWRVGKSQQMLGEWWENSFKDTLGDRSLPSWLGDFLWEAAKILSWVLVAFLLVFIIWKISPLFRNYLSELMRQIKPKKTINRSKKIREISVADWWQKAQNFQASGNYTEAIFCLYSGTLQQLNDRGIATNLPSRTDGEYLKVLDRLLRSRSYQILLNVHQDLCFGGTRADLNLWQRCCQAYQDLEKEA